MKESVDTPGVDDPGRGRRIGVDVGTVRIGVAASDSDGSLATPVETVARVSELADLRAAGQAPAAADFPDAARVADIAREYRAVEIIVGLPRNLSGHGSTSVHHARAFAAVLAALLPGVPVRLADERLTTVAATTALRSSGVTARRSRGVIDQAAAVEILQTWLDGRRAYLARATTAASESDAERPARPAPSPADLARRNRKTTEE